MNYFYRHIWNYDKYNVTPLFSIATPLYGTELYHESLNNGFINKDLTDEDFAEATRMEGKNLIETMDFNAEDIKNISEDCLNLKILEILNSVTLSFSYMVILLHSHFSKN